MSEKETKQDDEDLPISDYVSALVASVVAKSRSLASVRHTGIKGHFNEVLAKDLLAPFLPDFLRITSGKVVLRCLKVKGGYDRFTSAQQDVIVYDSRLLPPFIEMQGVGYVPMEAAIATVEVRYRQTNEKTAVEDGLKRQADVARLFGHHQYCALHAVLLLCHDSAGLDLKALLADVKSVQFLCVPGKGCAKRIRGELRIDEDEGEFYEATKGFIATFVDNCRTFAERRYRILHRKHKDWLSHYIRTQGRDGSPAR